MEVNLNMSQGEKTNFPHKVGHDQQKEIEIIKTPVKRKMGLTT